MDCAITASLAAPLARVDNTNSNMETRYEASEGTYQKQQEQEGPYRLRRRLWGR